MTEDVGIVFGEGDLAIRQMNDPGGIVTDDRPINRELFGDQCVGAVRLKTANNCRSGIKAVALMVESSSTAAGIDLPFQDDDIMPCLRKQGRNR